MSGPFVPPGAVLTNHADVEDGGWLPRDRAQGRSATRNMRGLSRCPLDGLRPKTMESNRAWRSPSAAAWLVFLSFSAIISIGCGGSEGAGRSHAATLDPWGGALRSLFDDSIHPAAVGLSLDGVPPEEDRLLRPRARAAHVVSRMRVTTVTADAIGAKETYYLTLQVGQPPLLPRKLPDPTFEFVVRADSPAYGIVSNLEASLRGRTFVGFVRRFTGDPDPEIHWHLTADTAEVALAISDATALERVKEP